MERDYIHVMDLTEGHLAALNHLEKNTGVYIYSLGTGKGITVLELINTFQQTNNVETPYRFVGKRNGYLPSYHADSNKVLTALGWQAKRRFDESCRDTFRHYFCLN